MMAPFAMNPSSWMRWVRMDGNSVAHSLRFVTVINDEQTQEDVENYAGEATRTEDAEGVTRHQTNHLTGKATSGSMLFIGLRGRSLIECYLLEGNRREVSLRHSDFVLFSLL